MKLRVQSGIAILLLLCSFRGAAEVVYDNSATRSTPARFAQTAGLEFGDEIVLASSGPRLLTNFTFEYYGLGFSGDETLRFRIYANDAVYGATFFAPGTVLYDSGSLAISASEGLTLSFEALDLVVATNFTWTVQFGGIGGAESAGLSLYDPPTIGSNPVDYWERSGTNDSWLLFGPNPYPALNFGARAQASPRTAAQLYSPALNSPLAVGNRPSGIWLGNLRGDGNSRDIVVANADDDNIRVLLFLGAGSFSDAGTYAVGTQPQGVRTADFNADGFEDIAVANYGGGTVSVLINQLRYGLGFSNRTDYAVGAGPIALTVADVNRDGRLDLLVANYLDAAVSVLPGLGGGTFDRDRVATYPVGTGPSSICIADFTGDDILDVVTANETAGTLTMLPGNADGSFQVAQVIASDPDYRPTYALWGYLDEDTFADIAVTFYHKDDHTGIMRVLKGQGNGMFDTWATYAVGPDPKSLLVRDLNRDQIPDVTVANNGNNGVQVFFGAGDGNFISQGTFAVGDQPTIVVGSNLNEDRTTDLAVVNTGGATPGNTVSVLMYAGPLADDMRLTCLEDAPLAIRLGGKLWGAVPADLEYYLFDKDGNMIGPVGGPTRYGWLQPVGHTRNVTYTPNPDKYVPNPDDGIPDSFTYYAKDRLGTLQSSLATVSLTVVPVNDPPAFSFNPIYWNSSENRFEVTVTEDAPAYTFPGFATNMSGGGWNEDRQRLTFLVSAADRAFFASQPLINPVTGNLTFRPAPNATSLGGVKVTVRLRDSGGTANGGVNTHPLLPASPEEFYVVIQPNPLKPLKGTYNGLFYEANDMGVPIVRHQTAGFFTLTMVASGSSANGAFTGKLTGEGGSSSFSGQFDQAGHAFTPVYRPNNSTLYLDLNLDLSGPNGDRVSGSVTAEGGAWTANHLEGYRAAFGAGNPAPWVGRYTMAFPGDDVSPELSPGGDGYCVVSVSSAGAVRVSGKLGEGTSFSQATSLSQQGLWPFYVLLYGKQGSALGWLKFAEAPGSLGMAATNRPLNWVKPALPGRFYPGGFTTQLFPLASAYTVPFPPGAPLYPGEEVVGHLSLMGGNLVSEELHVAALTSANEVVGGFAEPYFRLVSPATGVMAGQIFDRELSALLSLRGVVLKDQKMVRGYFIGTNQTGSVRFASP